MNSSSPICNLCKKNNADKKNSHILPRFLKRVIHNNENTKTHAFLYNRDHTKKIIQDIPKEDFIFCSDCEKKIGTLETYISRELGKLENFRTSYMNATITISGNNYKKLNSVRSDLFALFVYSLVWRMHISRNVLFKPFSLEKSMAEKIRELLNLHLEFKERDLKSRVEVLEELPFPYIFAKPNRIKDSTWGIYFNGTPYKGVWYVIAMSYIIIVTETEKLIPKQFLPVLNCRIDSPKVKISTKDEWQKLVEIMIDDFLH